MSAPSRRIAKATAFGGGSLLFTGEYTDAISIAQEAYEISKSIHNIWGQTFCLMILGFTYMELGEIDKSIQANQELLSFDPRQTFMIAQLSSRGQLADIYSELGDMDTGYEYVVSAVEQARVLEPGLQSAVLSTLARYDALRGNLVEAEKLFEKSIQNYDPQNFTTFIPQYIESARNELFMRKGQFSAALESLDQILAIIDRLEIVFCRPEFMLRKANALVALARRDDALVVLEEATSLAERLGSRRILWTLYALLGDLQSESGDSVKADAARRKAREHIGFLADHAPADLRRSFLQLPAVTKLLGE